MPCEKNEWGPGKKKKIKPLSRGTSERLNKKKSIVSKPPEFLTKEIVSPGSTSKESDVLCRG